MKSWLKMHNKFKQTEIGLIPEDWDAQKIVNLCEITSSKRIFLEEYVTKGIPFYRSKEIILLSQNQVITDPLFILEKRFNEIISQFGAPKEGDILMTAVGTLGIPYIVKKNDLFYFKDGNLMWFRAFNEKLQNKFIYYWIKSSYGQNQLNTVAIGSTQKALTIDSLKNTVIPLPPIPEQKAIVKILSDLDSKIELNQQMNKTLEEIGKALFKRWFVDFEFPNEQGKPYKLSGGEMVYNEELKKEIPKNSKIIYLKDQLIFERGIEPGSAVYENKNAENYLRFIRVSDLNNDVSNTFIPIELGTKTCDLENVLLSLDASVGIVKIGYSGAYSTGMRKVYDKQKKWSNGFIYFLLQSEEIQNTINQYAAGTTILHAGKSIEFMNLVVPNENVVKKFNIVVDSVYSQILSNIIENKKLAETRDLLLPKLMSGKIRVK